jgi:hypothetical protein
MTVEQAIDTALQADATLSASLGSRIYWLQVPQTSIVPYLVYFTVSDTDQQEAFGDSNTGQARVQFDIVSDKKSDKASLYRVRTILRGMSGTIGGLNVRHVFPVQIRERFDASTMRYIFTIELEITFAY